jgi:cell division protease FtsH
MVHEYGMGTATASVKAVTDADIVSDLTRRIRDEEQQELAFEAHRHAHHLIIEHRDTLERFAQELLENVVLERPQIDKIKLGVPRIERRPARPDLRVAAATKQPPREQS